MNPSQDRFILATLAVSESAWLFSLYGVAGVAFHAGGSPLSWPAVLAVLGFSIVTARTLHRMAIPWEVASLVQMLAGAVVIYLTVGTQVATGSENIDLGWIGTMASGPEVEGYTFKGAAGSFFGLLLWWRGGRMAASEPAADALASSFRLGIVALSLALVVDLASESDLNTFPMMFIYFAAGIAGLGLGRLLPGSAGAVSVTVWTKVIAGIIATVLLVGLVFSLLRGDILSFISEPLRQGFDLLATAFFYVFVLPLALALNALIGFFGEFFRGEPTSVDATGEAVGEQFLEIQAENGPPPGYLEVIEWALLGLLIASAFYVLARAYRRRANRRLEETAGLRESVREGADATFDMANLLFNLLPARLRRRKYEHQLTPPDGRPGVMEAISIYYRLLTLARRRGFSRPPSQTVVEYEHTLAGLFPKELVGMATEAFDRACYGDEPVSSERLGMMQSLMEEHGLAEQ